MTEALIAQGEELVAEQERLNTCVECLVTRARICALQLDVCPWRNSGDGNFIPVDALLPSKDGAL